MKIKKMIFKVLIFIFLLFLLCVSEYLSGFIASTDDIKISAMQFRNEVFNLHLTTKVLVPNSLHIYNSNFEQKRSKEFSNASLRYFRTNEDGEIQPTNETFMDENRSSIKIVFMGGSTTECNEVDEQLRFPFLVGKQIQLIAPNNNIQTINIGVRANTVHDSINLLLNHPSIRKADIVILMHNINDRQFLARTGFYETIVFEKKQISFHSVTNSVLNSLLLFYDYITYKSNLIFLVRTKIFHYNAWTGEEDIGNDKTNFYNKTEEQQSNKALISFKENLLIFINTVRLMNKQPILMTQALATQSKEHTEFNNVIRNVAFETSTLLIDIDSILTQKRDSLFLRDKIHLNNEGSAMVSNIITDHLSSFIFTTER